MENIPRGLLEELLITNINRVRDISSICSVNRDWLKFRSLRWKVIDPDTQGVRFNALLTYPNLVALEGPYVLMNWGMDETKGFSMSEGHVDNPLMESALGEIEIISCEISIYMLRSLCKMFKRCANIKIYDTKTEVKEDVSDDKAEVKEDVSDDKEDDKEDEMDERISISITHDEMTERKFSFKHMLETVVISADSLKDSLVFSREEMRDGRIEYCIAYHLVSKENAGILEEIVSLEGSCKEEIKGKSPRSISHTSLSYFLSKRVLISMFSAIHRDEDVPIQYVSQQYDIIRDFHSSLIVIYANIQLKTLSLTDDYTNFLENLQGFFMREDRPYHGIGTTEVSYILYSADDILEVLVEKCNLEKIKRLDILFNVDSTSPHPLISHYYGKGLKLDRYHLFHQGDIDDTEKEWIADRRKEGSIVELYEAV